MTLPFTPEPQPETATPTPAPGWPLALGLLVAALALAVALYFPSYADMVGIWWRSGTFNHCFLILPISLYLVHARRAELMQYTPRTSVLGLAALLGASLLWALGHTADIMAMQHLTVVAFWPLTAWALLGNRVAWALLFPYSYLLFAVPAGEALVPTLQDITARFAVTLLQWTGLPVLLEGRHISIPSGDFVVAEACSGINYLIASLALGTLYAYLQYRSPWRRAAFVLLSLLVPIAANGLRAYGIIMLAHLSDMKLAVGVDHLIYGWLFFGLVILLMFWLGNFFREDLLAAPQPPAGASQARASTRDRVLFGLLPTALALASGTLLAAWLAAGVALGPARIALPVVEGQWRGPELSEDFLGGTYPGAQRLAGVYDSAEGSLVLQAAYYARERQGEELVGALNRLYDDKAWLRLDAGSYTVPGQAFQVLSLRLAKGGQEYRVYTWYEVAGARTASPLAAKLHALWARLTRRPGGQAVLILAAPIGADPAASRRLLDSYLTTLAEPLAGLTLNPETSPQP